MRDLGLETDAPLWSSAGLREGQERETRATQTSRVACLAPGREFTSFTPKYELFTFFASPGQCFSKYAGH